MAYDTPDYSVSGLYPSSGILKNTTFRWLRLVLSNGPHTVGVSHPLIWGRKQIQFPKLCVVYEGESVNRSQIDTKHKACDIRTWKKKYVIRHILQQHWYAYPIVLSLRRNPQHRSLLNVVSAISAPPFQSLRHQRNICHPVVNRFTQQTLPIVNRKHLFLNILNIESFCPQKNAQQNAALR
jgi:hypothetical protein